MREKVLGAGIQSDDAVGRGGLFDLAHDGETFIAAGQEAQVYRRIGKNDWQFDPLERNPETGFGGVGIGSIAARTQSDVYMVGSVYPTSTDYDVTQDPSFSQDMSVEELMQLFRSNQTRLAQAEPSQPEPRAYHFDGREWLRLQIPTSNLINDIFIESENRVWMVGGGGTILLGNAEHGFRYVSFHGDTENLISITKFRDRMVIASDYGLYSFDGHMLRRIKPRLDPAINRSVPTPLKVQEVDDVLFYFDYKHGVHCWDGENWSNLPIPQELLVRSFEGLGPRD